MNTSGSAKTCAVTGANGYVGGRLKAICKAPVFKSWAGRRAPAGSGAVGFARPKCRQNFPTHALVHCAYDFKARKWNEIVATNVRGSEKLLRAAKASGVRRIIFISSISAFHGCRSMYGRAKLEIEQIALSLGAIVIRPGLVYGNSPGGIFGGLVRQVKGHRCVLLPGGGEQLPLVHDRDLGRRRALRTRKDFSAGPADHTCARRGMVDAAFANVHRRRARPTSDFPSSAVAAGVARTEDV
jgi:nucleoside-diphosphate-sugar epimerase